MSWKCEAQTAPSEWTANALRFATEDEAREYGVGLMMRWTLCLAVRAVASSDAVSYKMVMGEAVGV